MQGATSFLHRSVNGLSLNKRLDASKKEILYALKHQQNQWCGQLLQNGEHPEQAMIH